MVGKGVPVHVIGDPQKSDDLLHLERMEKLVVLRTNEGERPPEVTQVLSHYADLGRFLKVCQQICELLVYISEGDSRERNMHFSILMEKCLAVNAATDDREEQLLDLADFLETFWYTREGRLVPSEARILGAEHSNPLETLILIAAPSLVLTIMAGAMAYVRIRDQQDRTKIVDAIAAAAARGDAKTLAELKPYVQGAGEAAAKAVPNGLRFKIGSTDVQA